MLSKRFAVVAADDGVNGLEALRTQGPFAVVVADLQMPRMDGITMLREAARIAPEVVRVLYTGTLGADAVAEVTQSARLFRVVYKPATMTEFMSILGEAVEHHLRVVRTNADEG